MPAPFDLSYFGLRVACPIRGSIIDTRVYIIDEVMRNSLPFFFRRLGGSYPDLFIDLDRIEIHNLAADSLGKLDTERRLAGRGRARDCEDRSLHSVGDHG